MKKVFYFLASVKLAVPLMVVLLSAILVGTIYESKYNAEYASAVVYRSHWFLVLLILLFINVLFSTLTRLPWKKHHLGFLVTHLGMLLMLIGSFLTMAFGIDGVLQIYEKSSSNIVFLNENVLEANGQKVKIPRYISKKNNVGIRVSDVLATEFLPYTQESAQFQGGVTFQFQLKSQFFNVEQSLNTLEQPQIQMGPALFKITTGEGNSEIIKTNDAAEKKITKKIAKNNSDRLEVIDSSGTIVDEIKIEANRKYYKGKNFSIELKNYYVNAQIINNKISEGGQEGGKNPAVELILSKGQETKREILYGNIPEFSLNSNGVFGFKLRFVSNSHGDEGGNLEQGKGQEGLPAGHPKISESNLPTPTMSQGTGGGNEVTFQVIQKNNEFTKDILVSLKKNNAVVLEKMIKPNEVLQTPWMGMEITYLNLLTPDLEQQKNGVLKRPIEKDIEYKMPMPPSAMLISYGNGESDWIYENTEVIRKNQYSNGGQSHGSPIYYGKERIMLPFEVFLDRFEKIDYPGSQMAKSYKSFVRINSAPDIHEIYMNEPLKHQGYTLYQSSYQILPNGTAVSILSVNQDPGRFLKYLGSLIMCLGIILYTLSRSQRMKFFFQKRS